MKKSLILIVFLVASIEFTLGTVKDFDNNYYLGAQDSANVSIYGNIAPIGPYPYLRYNIVTNKWVFSNDGVNAFDFGSGSGSGLPPATTKGELAVYDGANWVALAGGANNQVLTFDSGLVNGMGWKAVGSGLPVATAKGDIAVFDGTDWVALPSGADGQVLTASSITGLGLEWGTASSSGVTGTAPTTINAIPRWSDAGAVDIKNSPVVISDTGSLTGVENLTASASVSANNIISTVDVSSVTGTFSGNVSGNNVIAAVDVSGVTGSFSGNVGANNITATGDVSSANMQVTGDITTSESPNRVLTTDATGKIEASAVTSATLGFLDATSSIQGQINSKYDTPSYTATNKLLKSLGLDDTVDTGITVTGTSGLADISDLIFTPQVTSPAHQEGLLFYDSETNSLAYYNDNASVVINVGRENITKVKNKTGATITDGVAVYVMGSTGNVPDVDYANTDTVAPRSTLGLWTSGSAANNASGYVTTFGKVGGVDTSTFLEGDFLYLSNVDGVLTNIVPMGLEVYHSVGMVTRSHATEGAIFVRPQVIDKSTASKSTYAVFDAENNVIQGFTNTTISSVSPISQRKDYSVGSFPAETPDVTLMPRNIGKRNTVTFEYTLTSGVAKAVLTGGGLASAIEAELTADKSRASFGFTPTNAAIPLSLEFQDVASAIGLKLDDIVFSDAPREVKEFTVTNSIRLVGNDDRAITDSTESIPFGDALDAADAKGWTYGADGSTPTTGNFYTVQYDNSIIDVTIGVDWVSAPTNPYVRMHNNGSAVAIIAEDISTLSSLLTTSYTSKKGQFNRGDKIAFTGRGGNLIDTTSHYLNITETATKEGTVYGSDKVVGDVIVEGVGNGGESLTVNVTPIPFTETSDDSNSWDGSTFTAPERGIYYINGSTRITTSNANGAVVWENRGSGFTSGAFVSSSTASTTTKGFNYTFIANNSGDQFQLRFSGSATLANGNHYIQITKASSNYDNLIVDEIRNEIIVDGKEYPVNGEFITVSGNRYQVYQRSYLVGTTPLTTIQTGLKVISPIRPSGAEVYFAGAQANGGEFALLSYNATTGVIGYITAAWTLTGTVQTMKYYDPARPL